jgi:hypothetical protein
VHHIENLRIAEHNDETRDDKRDDEERRFARPSLLIFQNATRPELFVVTKRACEQTRKENLSKSKETLLKAEMNLTPDAEQRGKLHSVTEEPAKGDHGRYPMLSVDSRVEIVMCDHYVSAQREDTF